MERHNLHITKIRPQSHWPGEKYLKGCFLLLVKGLPGPWPTCPLKSQFFVQGNLLLSLYQSLAHWWDLSGIQSNCGWLYGYVCRSGIEEWFIYLRCLSHSSSMCWSVEVCNLSTFSHLKVLISPLFLWEETKSRLHSCSKLKKCRRFAFSQTSHSSYSPWLQTSRICIYRTRIWDSTINPFHRICGGEQVGLEVWQGAIMSEEVVGKTEESFWPVVLKV